MVDLTVSPRDNETEEPFKRKELKFRIEYSLDGQEYETGWKTYINSKLRNSSND